MARETCGRGSSLLWLFAEQFAVRSIDEMKPATGLTDHGFVAALRIVRSDLIRQPMLNVHSGPGAFEDDMGHMPAELNGPAVFLPLIQINAVEPTPTPQPEPARLPGSEPKDPDALFGRVLSARKDIRHGSRPGEAFVRARSIHRLRHQADSKNRVLGLVQKLHLPFGIQFELAGNSANDIGANAGQFVPGGIAIGKLGALVEAPE